MRIDLNVQCFGAIARTIAEKDKPLVIIGDGDSVPDASAAGGSEPRMVVRESDLAMIREQLRSAARAESSDASHDMLLSQAVSNHPPVDLEGVLEGMATDELSMFVGGGVELQARAAALSRTTRVAACSRLALVGHTPPARPTHRSHKPPSMKLSPRSSLRRRLVGFSVPTRRKVLRGFAPLAPFLCRRLLVYGCEAVVTHRYLHRHCMRYRDSVCGGDQVIKRVR